MIKMIGLRDIRLLLQHFRENSGRYHSLSLRRRDRHRHAKDKSCNGLPLFYLGKKEKKKKKGKKTLSRRLQS